VGEEGLEESESRVKVVARGWYEDVKREVER